MSLLDVMRLTPQEISLATSRSVYLKSLLKANRWRHFLVALPTLRLHFNTFWWSGLLHAPDHMLLSMILLSKRSSKCYTAKLVLYPLVPSPEMFNWHSGMLAQLSLMPLRFSDYFFPIIFKLTKFTGTYQVDSPLLWWVVITKCILIPQGYCPLTQEWLHDPCFTRFYQLNGVNYLYFLWNLL